MTKKTRNNIIAFVVSLILSCLAALGICKIIDLLDEADKKEKKYRRLSSGLDEEDELELIDLDVAQDDVYNDSFAEMAEANK